MITRDQLRIFMADGRWCSGMEILDHFQEMVRPEEAAQEYYRKNPKIANDVPMDAAVRLGTEMLLSDLLRSAGAAELTEATGPRRLLLKRFRWTAWHCWLCGNKVCHSERSKNGLCANCEEALKEQGHASVIDANG